MLYLLVYWFTSNESKKTEIMPLEIQVGCGSSETWKEERIIFYSYQIYYHCLSLYLKTKKKQKVKL